MDENGDYVNGKRTVDVHWLRADVDLDANRVTLQVRGDGRPREFHLDRDRDAFEGNLYRLMAVTRIPRAERDGELRVDDDVRLVDANGR